MICSLHSASNWCFTFSSACGYMIRVNGKKIETNERKRPKRISRKKKRDEAKWKIPKCNKWHWNICTNHFWVDMLGFFSSSLMWASSTKITWPMMKSLQAILYYHHTSLSLFFFFLFCHFQWSRMYFKPYFTVANTHMCASNGAHCTSARSTQK